jgi:hypothetical protein
VRPQRVSSSVTEVSDPWVSGDEAEDNGKSCTRTRLCNERAGHPNNNTVAILADVPLAK